jgi:hypothetical protein
MCTYSLSDLGSAETLHYRGSSIYKNELFNLYDKRFETVSRGGTVRSSPPGVSNKCTCAAHVLPFPQGVT